jgi:hypothetical protein
MGIRPNMLIRIGARVTLAHQDAAFPAKPVFGANSGGRAYNNQPTFA